ncbi:MAG: N-acetyl-gamma-glutamyl-phosphate reductase [Bacteroidales bacterium]|nr:N-acetyl-gamma-glutamyl-phosphate reductase [Bacteroidales bacterium]
MSEKKIRVGIIGGAGYTAGELLRLLINHPNAEIAWVHSTSNAGAPIASVHEGLIGDTDLAFSENYDLAAVDAVFLCSAHGKSREFWQENKQPDGLRIIDLAQDFRDESEGYVYGLPEAWQQRIEGAQKVANPGCFATALQLSLLPLANAGMLATPVQITAVTGSTGAGVKPAATTHFSWRNDNLSVYKAFEHQHLKEIRATLEKLQGGPVDELNFVPVRGDFPRGIFAISHIDTDMTLEDARKLYEDYYRDAAFTHVAPGAIDLKQAVNTNKAIIGLEKHGRKLLITCAIDNLLKGASGQAVQNFNLMFGLPQTTGLKLKPSAF